jgi:hypothetical protein
MIASLPLALFAAIRTYGYTYRRGVGDVPSVVASCVAFLVVLCAAAVALATLL